MNDQQPREHAYKENEFYDSFVDSVQDPTIFVTTRDFMAYPAFIIEYQRTGYF